MRPLFQWAFKDITMPPYLQRLAAAWTSKKSSKGSKAAMGKNQLERIELQSSESTKDLTTSESVKKGAYAFESGRLEEGSTENLEGWGSLSGRSGLGASQEKLR
jgi:hypothetical protein